MDFIPDFVFQIWAKFLCLHVCPHTQNIANTHFFSVSYRTYYAVQKQNEARKNIFKTEEITPNSDTS